MSPLKRLYPVVEDVGKLFGEYVKGQYLEARPEGFRLFTELVMVNLAYIKLEKYRILKEYKSCK